MITRVSVLLAFTALRTLEAADIAHVQIEQHEVGLKRFLSSIPSLPPDASPISSRLGIVWINWVSPRRNSGWSSTMRTGVSGFRHGRSALRRQSLRLGISALRAFPAFAWSDVHAAAKGARAFLHDGRAMVATKFAR